MDSLVSFPKPNLAALLKGCGLDEISDEDSLSTYDSLSWGSEDVRKKKNVLHRNVYDGQRNNAPAYNNALNREPRRRGSINGNNQSALNNNSIPTYPNRYNGSVSGTDPRSRRSTNGSNHFAADNNVAPTYPNYNGSVSGENPRNGRTTNRTRSFNVSTNNAPNYPNYNGSVSGDNSRNGRITNRTRSSSFDVNNNAPVYAKFNGSAMSSQDPKLGQSTLESTNSGANKNKNNDAHISTSHNSSIMDSREDVESKESEESEDSYMNQINVVTNDDKSDNSIGNNTSHDLNKNNDVGSVEGKRDCEIHKQRQKRFTEFTRNANRNKFIKGKSCDHAT